MNIEFIPIDLVDDYENNSNTHPPGQIHQIKSWMLYVGWTAIPLVRRVDDRYGIISGHGRRDSAVEIYAEGGVIKMADGTPIPPNCIPAVFADGWTKEQITAYVHADNLIARESITDQSVLDDELAALRDMDFDMDLMGLEFAPDTAGSPEDSYTRKIESPVYEPKGPKPEISELFDDTKTRTLIAEIDASDIPDEIVCMLKAAAERHTVFNFGKIAEFYAHSDPATQQLMESSAMVIIDFDQAVENGFVKLTSRMSDLFSKDYPDEE